MSDNALLATLIVTIAAVIIALGGFYTLRYIFGPQLDDESDREGE